MAHQPPPEFYGEDTEIYFENLEKYFILHNITDDLKYHFLRFSLKGDAENYYEVFCTKTITDQTKAYEQLKETLLKAFPPKYSKSNLYEQFYGSKQGYGESASSFILNKISLSKKLDLKLTAAEIIDIVLDQIDPQIAFYLEQKYPTNFEELFRLTKQYEERYEDKPGNVYHSHKFEHCTSPFQKSANLFRPKDTYPSMRREPKIRSNLHNLRVNSVHTNEGIKQNTRWTVEVIRKTKHAGENINELSHKENEVKFESSHKNLNLIRKESLEQNVIAQSIKSTFETDQIKVLENFPTDSQKLGCENKEIPFEKEDSKKDSCDTRENKSCTEELPLNEKVEESESCKISEMYGHPSNNEVKVNSNVFGHTQDILPSELQLPQSNTQDYPGRNETGPAKTQPKGPDNVFSSVSGEANVKTRSNKRPPPSSTKKSAKRKSNGKCPPPHLHQRKLGYINYRKFPSPRRHKTENRESQRKSRSTNRKMSPLLWNQAWIDDCRIQAPTKDRRKENLTSTDTGPKWSPSPHSMDS